MNQTLSRKKLIEVALPLEAINKESAKEKSIRHGHPSTIHLWWARRPLAACRAVIFGQLVDDPSSVPEEFGTPEAQDKERRRLFTIIEKMVLWKSSHDEFILHQARVEIARSIARNKKLPFDSKMTRAQVLAFLDVHAPPVLDPFCGGGSIPLEAQRLGLRAYGSDLNPVALLITKALVELPSRFANATPINPTSRTQSKLKGTGAWEGARGLGADVRYYGNWMLDEAKKRIGAHYPLATIPPEQGGGTSTVIAWLWSRTVSCANPACKATIPLVRNFSLSTKSGRNVFVQPVVREKAVSFSIRTDGTPPPGTVRKRAVTCLVCGSQATLDYVRAEAQAGRMGAIPLATVAEAKRGRIYLAPDGATNRPLPQSVWKPDQEVEKESHDVNRLPLYGMFTWGDAFTERQLLALDTLATLVGEVRRKAKADAESAGMPIGKGLASGGKDALAYAEAVSHYLALGVSRFAMTGNALVAWNPHGEKAQKLFSRQAITMMWDFAETNPLGTATGSWESIIELVASPLEMMPLGGKGLVEQRDATTDIPAGLKPVVSTDPPYYDNIGYADLSDFFYVWLRRMLGEVYPQLTTTVLTPKKPELVAMSYRFDGGKEEAKSFFETGLGKAFDSIHRAQDHDYPLAVYYAFKQSDDEEDAPSDDDEGSASSTAASSGWETMLEGLVRAGFAVNGTLPMRTEMRTRQVAMGTNALASSIVLVCRPREAGARIATRQEFVRLLKAELPEALRKLQHGNIAPVDLAQAAIGPGMSVYSRFVKVVESSGESMPVRAALQLINQELALVLQHQETEFDSETRWAIDWFRQYGFSPGAFGDANLLATAKAVSVEALRDKGLVKSGQGKVQLVPHEQYPIEYDPLSDGRLSVWKFTHHLVNALVGENGSEANAAAIYCKAAGLHDQVKDLAYLLFSVCDAIGKTQDGVRAQQYNALVTSLPEIAKLCDKGKGGLDAFT